MIVIHSSRRDVYENLAAEDVMLDDDALTEPVLFIYRNDDAVVIGKNQNPWRECAVSRLPHMHIQFARRITGGGTVFHDQGNINISCIVPRAAYQRDAMLHTFISGLRLLGVDAEVAASTSLAVGGKKISGNAFCYRRSKVLHHGTLLWQADLEKLRVCLKPDVPEMETRAVCSCPMPVVNLADMLPENSIGDVIGSMLEAITSDWGPVADSKYCPFDADHFQQRVAAMKSWDWLYGATPDFSIQSGGRTVTVHRGLIQGAGGKFSSSV